MNKKDFLFILLLHINSPSLSVHSNIAFKHVDTQPRVMKCMVYAGELRHCMVNSWGKMQCGGYPPNVKQLKNQIKRVNECVDLLEETAWDQHLDTTRYECTLCLLKDDWNDPATWLVPDTLQEACAEIVGDPDHMKYEYITRDEFLNNVNMCRSKYELFEQKFSRNDRHSVPKQQCLQLNSLLNCLGHVSTYNQVS